MDILDEGFILGDLHELSLTIVSVDWIPVLNIHITFLAGIIGIEFNTHDNISILIHCDIFKE